MNNKLKPFSLYNVHIIQILIFSYSIFVYKFVFINKFLLKLKFLVNKMLICLIIYLYINNVYLLSISIDHNIHL